MTREQILANMNAYMEETIRRSGTEVTMDILPRSVCNKGNRTAIANVVRKALRGEKVTMCIFGGSITEGACRNDFPPAESGIQTDYGPLTYCDHVFDFWEKMFDCEFDGKNVGIGATDTVYAIHRQKTDVLSHNPDLVIVEWCCNDSPEFFYKQATYEKMIRELLEAGTAVLMYSMSVASGITSQDLHEPLSVWYDVPMISYRNAYMPLAQFPYFTTDSIHPNRVGYSLAGLLVNYFIADVLKDLDEIGETLPALRQDVYNKEASYYEGAHTATLKDIYDGKIAGARIKDLGSFVIDEKQSRFVYKQYYGFTAPYGQNYAPLVIEIDDCKTLFLLIYRNTVFDHTDFKVFVDGVEMDSVTFTCKHGTDNEQTEWDYHWATERICYNPVPKKITLEILPANTNPEAFIRLFALLLS